MSRSTVSNDVIEQHVLATAGRLSWPLEAFLGRWKMPYWQVPPALRVKGLRRLLYTRGEEATALLVLSMRWGLLSSILWILTIVVGIVATVAAIVVACAGAAATVCCVVRMVQSHRVSRAARQEYAARTSTNAAKKP